MRRFIGSFALALSICAGDNVIQPDEWKNIPDLSAEWKNGAVTIFTELETYGEFRQLLNIPPSFPKKVRISFRYWTQANMPANASFAFSWSFMDHDGEVIVRNSSYNRLPAAVNGKRMLFSTDVPMDADKMLVKFQPQGPKDGRFIPSYAKISDFAVTEGGPSKEAIMLIATPLTQSDRVKRWPNTPLRGLGIVSVSASSTNAQDPDEFITEGTFKKLSHWGVNSVRADISFETGSMWDVKRGEKIPPIPPDDPMAPYRKKLDAMRIVLHLAEKYGVSVIIQCEPVGRRIDVMYQEGDAGGWEQELIKVWTYVAHEFGGHPNVIGYDLLNEPNGKEEEGRWRKDTLPKLCEAIRAIDRNTYLVVEPAPWGLPWGLENFKPIDDAKVVYSFHHYMPHSYTHQGIYSYVGPKFENKPYPGMLSRFGDTPDMPWNKEELEKSMQAAIAFQKANNAILYVGEFSVLRWAPGGEKWLRDSIDIFEEHGMSWSFHGYGSWNGWNPTFDAADEQNSELDGGKMTDRLQVLLDGWKKNMR